MLTYIQLYYNFKSSFVKPVFLHFKKFYRSSVLNSSANASKVKTCYSSLNPLVLICCLKKPNISFNLSSEATLTQV